MSDAQDVICFLPRRKLGVHTAAADSLSALLAQNCQIALYSVAPTGFADDGTELAGSGYARQTVATSEWDSSVDGQLTNAEDITFPTASADWAEVVALVVRHSAHGGHLHAVAAVAPAVLLSGQHFRIPAGQLLIRPV